MDTPISKIVVEKAAAGFMRVRIFLLKQRKGWQLASSTLKNIGIDQWRREKARSTYYMNGKRDGGYGRPSNNTGWWRRRVYLVPMIQTERMLMRHGWYRRKLRKQGISMKDVGKNSVILTAAGIPPEKLGARL